MRIVVVGATGNIGTALLRRLGSQPEVSSVLGIARRLPATREPYDGAEWSAVDVGTPDAAVQLARAFEGADAVVNFAWALQPNHDERAMYRTNVTGLVNVLAAAGAAGVAQVVHASSIAAYSPGPKTRVDEVWPTGGIQTSHYGRHKAIGERLLDTFAAANPSIAVTRLRPGFVFQEDAGREIRILFLGRWLPFAPLIAAHLPALTIPRQIIGQAVHADDAAAAFWLAIEHRAAGAFNIAAEPVLGPDEIARGLNAARAVHVPLGLARAVVHATWLARLHRTDPGWLDVAASVPLMSMARAREVLGWVPRVSATDALTETTLAMAERHGVQASPALWDAS